MNQLLALIIIIIIIMIKACWQHRFPWLFLSLTIHPYRSLLLVSLLDIILYLIRADEYEFLKQINQTKA